MRSLTKVLGLLLLLLCGWALAQSASKKEHKMLTPDQITWGKPPPGLPSNLEAAVLDGDPTKAGLYVVRLRFPDGLHIPAHWHTKDENITVISGRFRMAMGEKFDEATLKDFPPGSFVTMPA